MDMLDSPVEHASVNPPRAVCRKAIEVQDPICKNGGYLRAENITAEPTSCADCVCPPNWDGADCGRECWLDNLIVVLWLLCNNAAAAAAGTVE